MPCTPDKPDKPAATARERQEASRARLRECGGGLITIRLEPADVRAIAVLKDARGTNAQDAVRYAIRAVAKLICQVGE